MATAINISALKIGYRTGRHDHVHVAGPMDLKIDNGEVTCLIGANGSGKTTLIKTISTLQPPMEGKIEVLGKDPEHLDRKERSRMLSLVLTGQPVPDNMKVHELVALGRYPHTGWFGSMTASDRRQIKEALQVTGILKFANRRVMTLSDGERQKAMIARALAQDTPVILLDEPTAHLDIPNRVSIIMLLRKLAEKTGKAILLSTHELELALQTADRLWLIKGDKTAVEGVPEELVLDGTIGSVFNTRNVRFDLKSGTFRMMNDQAIPLSVTGAGDALIWTRHALERIGYKYSDERSARASVSVIPHGQSCRWLLTGPEDQTEFGRLSELIEHLKQRRAL